MEKGDFLTMVASERWDLVRNKDQDLLGCHLTMGAIVPEELQEIFGELFGVDAESVLGRQPVDDSSINNLTAEAKEILHDAEQLVRAVNTSIKVAQEASSIKTRKFEIATARAKIIELKRMTVRHSVLQIDRLEEVVLLLAQIEQETTALKYQDGRVLEKQGRIAEAIAAYERLVQKVVNNPAVYKRLAILYRKIRSREDEARILRDALRNLSESNKKHYEWFKARLSKIERNKNASTKN